MLDLLLKLRSVHRLPPDLHTAVDNAVSTCKPPEVSAQVVDERPPMHRYIVWLLHHHLSKHNVEKVIRQLRKLPWGDTQVRPPRHRRDTAATPPRHRRVATKAWPRAPCRVTAAARPSGPQVQDWVHHALLDCASVKYHIIALVASVVSGLCRYHEAAMLRFVDATLEAARLTVERNDFREAQRRVCLMRLIGELYNYQMVDSAVVFQARQRPPRQPAPGLPRCSPHDR